MAIFTRRLHLVVRNSSAIILRDRLKTEFNSLNVDSIKEQIGIAKIAPASNPTNHVAFGLSGIFTQTQWDRLKDFKLNNPDLLTEVEFKGSLNLYDNFWVWALTLTPPLVPLQEIG